MRSSTTGELHELGLAAAVRAIRNREVSSEIYVTTLLERAWEQADLKAFITIDDASVCEAAGRRIDPSERETVAHCSVGITYRRQGHLPDQRIDYQFRDFRSRRFQAHARCRRRRAYGGCGCDCVRQEQPGGYVVRIDRAQ
jgi:hypothetical protein